MKGKKGATISKEAVKKEVLGCEAVTGSLTPSNTRKYKLKNRLWEGDLPLYGISYNFIDSRFFNVFATVGGNRVSTPIPLIWLSYVREFFEGKMIEFVIFLFTLDQFKDSFLNLISATLLFIITLYIYIYLLCCCCK